MNIQQWLNGISERERKLVYLMAGLGAAALLYGLLVLPFQLTGSKLEKRVAKKTADLAWMQQMAPQLEQASAAVSSRAGANESLVVIIDRTAREAGLGPTLRDQSPEGNGTLRLRLEGAQFDTLMAWLASLQTQFGIGADAATIDSTAPGLVNANLTLSRSEGPR